MITTVSTSLIPPTLCYALTLDNTHTYHFAHPTYWHPNRADVGMDACNAWGQVEDAKDAFWEFVAGSVVWPAASVVAGEIVEGARLAGIERAKVEAGIIELFG